MKSRFSTIDIAVIVQDLKRFLGMRVMNVYDIDNKTYLIRVGRPDEKCVILLESGIRLHSTDFDWPKNPAPSGFSMKLRKHLKNRRFESITQLGIDRIVDLQFGSGEAAYHVVLELYDRGNIVLTDFEYTILNILRPRTDKSEDVRFAVREKYPIEGGKTHIIPTEERILELLKGGKVGDHLKKIFVQNLDYGPAIIDHVLLSAGFSENVKIGSGFDLDTDFPKLMSGISEAESLLNRFLTQPCQGYIIQKKDKKPKPAAGESEEIILYDEFHPFLFKQHSGKSYVEFESFNKSADEFFSKQESQKLDMKVIQHEKNAFKKLDNVKKDHEKRIQGLQKEQESDTLRGQLIEMNLEMVDKAILIVRSAVANQIDWSEIWNLVKEAQINGDPVASAIKSLKLDTNQMTVLLHDPYVAPDGDTESEYQALKPMRVDLDLTLSAYGNSRKYFDKKKLAAKKQQKTVEASNKAFKSAEKKTKQSLKEVQTAVSINKTRKTYWFEKFLWFISSENYLVIGGRDQQQNEIIVKRYMKSVDLYVHADLHGASSCVIKNPGGGPVPPKTLNEAGTMAICNSAAWDSKVVTSAWWVYHDQVSKTAPSGEYLTTGSFMIRGRKNYLPPSYLIYGFGLLFKLEESSIERHQGERRVRMAEDDDAMSVTSYTQSSVTEDDDDVELNIDEDDSSDSEDEANTGNDTKEEDTLPETGEEHDPVEEDEDGQLAEDNVKTSAVSEDRVECKPDNIENVSSKIKSVSIADPKVPDKKHPASKASGVEFAFPDTNINLQHVKGDKYELHREFSTGSNADPDVFFLGDSVPVTFGEKGSTKTGRISAKQRREMKKKKGAIQETEGDDEEDNVSWLKEKKATPKPVEIQESRDDDDDDEETTDGKSSTASTVAPSKRGQKSKRKKIKEKYGHQDEEERILRMEILASAGETKAKSKKAAKEASQGKQKQGGPDANRPKSGQGKGQGQGAAVEVKGKESEPQLLFSGEGEASDVQPQESKPEKKPQVKQDPDSDGEKEEDNIGSDDLAILNSLTGIPVTEDELLYAIPVCAPYNALLNYKYKVKLMPGNTKKGKAMKTALGVFIHDKNASNREKDLLKIQKDVDLARNVPGKVKVAAPNMHKGKR